MRDHFHCEVLITDGGLQFCGVANSWDGALSGRNFKIYILSLKSRFLYVGKTKQPIESKLKQGFRSYKWDREGRRKSGYGGYGWIKEYINSGERLRLDVFDLGTEASDNQAESIEAEIVYLVRRLSNRWPESQHEIHFFNDFKDSQMKAEEIYRVVISCYENK